MYTILVVDDHPIFRKGLVALLESQEDCAVSAEAGSIAEALERLAENRPDIVLMDISLGKDNGLDLVRRMKEEWPRLPVLIVTMHDEFEYVERSIRAGARGLVMKQADSEIILEAVRTVLAGKNYLSPRMNELLLESMFHSTDSQSEKSVDHLSERELEVFDLIGQGYGAKEIADTLCLAVKTINTYKERLKEKLDLKTSADVRRFAIARNRSGEGH